MRRFELRNPDATCNPYFAYAAILMAGLDGIKNKIDPHKNGWGPDESSTIRINFSVIKQFIRESITQDYLLYESYQ